MKPSSVLLALLEMLDSVSQSITLNDIFIKKKKAVICQAFSQHTKSNIYQIKVEFVKAARFKMVNFFIGYHNPFSLLQSTTLAQSLKLSSKLSFINMSNHLAALWCQLVACIVLMLAPSGVFSSYCQSKGPVSVMFTVANKVHFG